MAYEVTATRKRPQDFDHLIGQEFVVSTLKNSIRSERVAHAYLFAGPRGVGKTSAARILAKALNCPTGMDSDACFDWAGADDIAKGRSIDVIEIDGASNTSVNDVRAIKDEVLFPPQNSRYKIYIIDEVHMLSNSAFNALLKTIEEPPPYIIFIFATTELHKVPATIRSRCQQFVFRLISIDSIRDRLAEAAAELSVKADEEALYWIAKESTGSMRDAYTLFDQVVAFSDGHIKLESIREKLGLVGLEQINQMALLCHKADTAGVFELFHAILVSGVSVEQFVIDLTEYYRGILFIQSGIEREALLGYSKDRFLPEAVKDYTRPQLEKIIGILLQTYRDLRYSIDSRFELEVSLSRICRMRSYVEPDELYENIRQLEQNIRKHGAMQSVVSSTETPQIKIAVVDQAVEKKIPQVVRNLDIEHRNAVIQSIRASKLTLATLLEQVYEWAINDDILSLSLESRYAGDTLKIEQQAIIEACRDVVPGIKSIEIRITEKSPESAINAGKPDARVEKIREAFRGEIIGQGVSS